MRGRSAEDVRQRFNLPDDLAPEAHAKIKEALAKATRLKQEELPTQPAAGGSAGLAVLSHDSLVCVFGKVHTEDVPQAALVCSAWALAALEDAARSLMVR